MAVLLRILLLLDLDFDSQKPLASRLGKRQLGEFKANFFSPIA
jgi:hypothetical protein